ncbi:MAG: OpgC domain-containing protein [Rhodospirillales bacterium]|nr:OpgC domain-containing protein [Rhodospirillales bacterium]
MTVTRPPRDLRLDILRGAMQIVIFASHTPGSFIGGWLIPASWGLSDSSEQFVFLSGVTLGGVFAWRLAGRGFAAAWADMAGRTLLLYRAQLLLVASFALLMLGVAALQGSPATPRALGWGFLFAHPLAALPGLLSMLYQPDDMGVLPVFIACMLVLPLFVALIRRAGVWSALAASCAVYATSWLAGLWPPSLGPDTGIAFNPFAWQFLFLLGAALGGGWLVLPGGRGAPRASLILAGLVLAAGLYLRLAWYGFLPWAAPFAEQTLITGKEGLALPRLVHALALVWLVAWAMPPRARWMAAAPARALARIGRHSLAAFCLGVFLSFAAGQVLAAFPGARAVLDPLVIGAGALALVAFAAWREQMRAGRAPGLPAMAGAPSPGRAL